MGIRVRPYLDCRLPRLLSQQISIDLLVTVLKEDRFPAIPTLRNVMRKACNHVRANRAMVKTNTNNGTGDRYHVPLSPESQGWIGEIYAGAEAVIGELRYLQLWPQ